MQLGYLSLNILKPLVPSSRILWSNDSVAHSQEHGLWGGVRKTGDGIFGRHQSVVAPYSMIPSDLAHHWLTPTMTKLFTFSCLLNTLHRTALSPLYCRTETLHFTQLPAGRNVVIHQSCPETSFYVRGSHSYTSICRGQCAGLKVKCPHRFMWEHRVSGMVLEDCRKHC